MSMAAFIDNRRPSVRWQERYNRPLVAKPRLSSPDGLDQESRCYRLPLPEVCWTLSGWNLHSTTNTWRLRSTD